MTTNSQERMYRVQESLKEIPKKETPKKKVYGLLMLKWGVSKRTAIEYLDALLAGDLIGENEESIWRVK